MAKQKRRRAPNDGGSIDQRANGRWRLRVRVDGRQVTYGLFDNEDAAIHAQARWRIAVKGPRTYASCCRAQIAEGETTPGGVNAVRGCRRGARGVADDGDVQGSDGDSWLLLAGVSGRRLGSSWGGVLVNDATEHVVSDDLAGRGRGHRLGKRLGEPESSVRTRLVVVAEVVGDDGLEVASGEDQ